MNKAIRTLITCLWLIPIFLSVSAFEVRAATISELTSKTASLSAKDRKEFLVSGAKKEGQMVYYGTLPVNQFAALVGERHCDERRPSQI